MQWYIVGGAVRDILMGLMPHDADLAYTGDAEEFLRAFPEAQNVGRSVAVTILEGKECMPLAGGNIASDLAARDLTINALAVDQDGILHAHPRALSDLLKGILRPASNTAFFDDATRVYRLARFAARFPEFTVHPEAIAQAHAVITSGLHLSLPPERVGNELRKALRSKKPSRFLDVLQQAQAFNHWFKELEQAHTVPAGPLPWHDNSVLAHTGQIMDKLAGDEIATWMGLCHDLGKLTTEQALLPHHYGHEDRGSNLAVQLGKRLFLPARHISAGQLATREHMKAGMFEKLRVGTKRDLLHATHRSGFFQSFWKLADADSGRCISAVAQNWLTAMLNVRLPEKWRNQGAESGRHLRLMQCEALHKFKELQNS